MIARVGSAVLMLIVAAGCVEHRPPSVGDRGVSDEQIAAVAPLDSFQRVWALTQDAKPIREEFGSDCLVALNVYYTTAVTDDILVLRNSVAMDVDGFAKKRVAMFDTVIHSRLGEQIDVPHQVRLAIQEREIGVPAFQRLYIGLDRADGYAKNPMEGKARADATEFRRQYGKVCEDRKYVDLSVPVGSFQ